MTDTFRNVPRDGPDCVQKHRNDYHFLSFNTLRWHIQMHLKLFSIDDKKLFVKQFYDYVISCPAP